VLKQQRLLESFSPTSIAAVTRPYYHVSHFKCCFHFLGIDLLKEPFHCLDCPANFPTLRVIIAFATASLSILSVSLALADRYALSHRCPSHTTLGGQTSCTAPAPARSTLMWCYAALVLQNTCGIWGQGLTTQSQCRCAGLRRSRAIVMPFQLKRSYRSSLLPQVSLKSLPFAGYMKPSTERRIRNTFKGYVLYHEINFHCAQQSSAIIINYPHTTHTHTQTNQIPGMVRSTE
jgi:hypothetical protein